MGEKEAGNNGYVKWFSELSQKSKGEAGLKAANLAEMYNSGFPVPIGFVVTSKAFEYFINENGLDWKIKDKIDKIDFSDLKELEKTEREIKELIEKSEIPKDMEESILEAYDVLDIDKNVYSNSRINKSALDILSTGHEMPFVSIRCSSISENEKISFAGQQKSMMFVKGKRNITKGLKKVFSSLYNARALQYRKIHSLKLDMSAGVIVQKMIDSEKSGVAFSKNPMKDDKNMIIESVWGQGKGLVSGKINPDLFVMNSEYNIVDRKISNKKIAFVRNSSGKIERVSLSDEKSKQESLTGHELKILSQNVTRLEELFGSAQNIEFAIESGKIFITQSRPITNELLVSEGEIDGETLISGVGSSGGVKSGIVRVINNSKDLENVNENDILVVKDLDTKSIGLMNKITGIISETGGVLSHGSILSRELGIPYIVDAESATSKLTSGQTVTVDGFTGKVVDGKMKVKKFDVKPVRETKMKIKLVVNSPEHALSSLESGIKEIGLIRTEKIIKDSGRHVNWYIKNNKLEDYISLLHRNIEKIVSGYEKIWIRTSSLRSDKHNKLEGAPEIEVNPRLGNHGIRFLLKNHDLFDSELKAIKELADEFSEKKFGILLSKIISLEELTETKKIIKNLGMPKNVKLGVMIETPAAVQIINDLCEAGIDFVNIGLKDLTQHTLAVDKNNEEISDLHNEMNPAVLNSVKYVLRRCKKYGIETSVFGDLNDLEKVKFLVNQGVDSFSVEAEDAKDVSEAISKVEESQDENKEILKMKIEKPNIELNEKTDQEDLILKALEANGGNIEKSDFVEDKKENEEEESEYVPGEIENENTDIPLLNEAIPVHPDLFEPVQDVEEKIEEEVRNISTDEGETEFGIEDQNTELETTEDAGEVYEIQQDVVLNEEVKKEADEYEEYQRMQEEAKKRKQQGNGGEEGGGETLDIF